MTGAVMKGAQILLEGYQTLEMYYIELGKVKWRRVEAGGFLESECEQK
jgi:hypothetical protein